MKNFKNFYLSYIKGSLCKLPLENAKNYFYDFFKKNIIEESELARLNELKKLVDAPEDVKLIEDKIRRIETTCFRNSHIFTETVNKIEMLQKQNSSYHELIYQAIWLKNILKYYPNQEEYVLKDYGIFATELAKSLNSQDEDKVIYYIERLLSFFEEYRFAIQLAINSLKNLECKLIHGLKINHALQMGYETYLTGAIKNDGVVAALLSDALQYSSNAERLQKRIEKITKEFNGKKVINIYLKTGQDPSLQKEPWDVRKKHQLKVLTTPGTSSFSALVILLIGKKINLDEIAKLFKMYENKYKSDNPDATQDVIDAYMTEKKAYFWHEYSFITESDAKEYYSKLAYVFNKILSIPEFLFEEYEDNYIRVFNDYPII